MRQMRAEVWPRSRITPEHEAEMFRLYETYFESTSEAIFSEDLASKHSAIVLFDATERIQGFSTLELIEFEGGRAIFSGDTIVNHEFWGEQTLPVAWCRYAGQIKARHKEEPLYWFLISKGYRTYRYLPLFAHAYHPSWRSPTPPETQRLMDALARRKFGKCYIPAKGVVRFPKSRGQLRESWAGISPVLRTKPEVRFFLERNPGYRRGDELVCLTELSEANMRSFARMAFAEGMSSQHV
ncbi:MAG: hypothetical protein ACRD8O_02565 [Bryobacteraceae bacterium]